MYLLAILFLKTMNTEIIITIRRIRNIGLAGFKKNQSDYDYVKVTQVTVR